MEQQLIHTCSWNIHNICSSREATATAEIFFPGYAQKNNAARTITELLYLVECAAEGLRNNNNSAPAGNPRPKI